MLENQIKLYKIIPEASSLDQILLTSEALDFLIGLHQEFHSKILFLLEQRKMRQIDFNRGLLPNFLKETQPIRDDLTWQTALPPHDLMERKVEITGPVERKMMINALNSGASFFMADFEDSLSPTWTNVLQGQINLIEAVKKTLTFNSVEGKSYKLQEKIATLMVRPRGWHLQEKHFLIKEKPISASLFDFGLYFFYNTHELLKSGSGPYFYLPKLESALEAKLWNDVFIWSQDKLHVPRGTIKATVLIETLPAAFEMEEILFELKEHCVGLNAGRWDYLFSIIKKFQHSPTLLFPDRGQLTMDVPFMKNYTDMLVHTCHKRKAHAIGGMAAFIPSRKDKEINNQAFKKVREDKEREVNNGFDGTWVAHPDLVLLAREVFDSKLKEKPHQKEVLRSEIKPDSKGLLDFNIPMSGITEKGLRQNINVTLLYLEAWLNGIGAAAIHNLMEDAATAEISRAQLWQWLHHQPSISINTQKLTVDYFKQVCLEEYKSILSSFQQNKPTDKLTQAKNLLEKLVLSDQFEDFLTLPAYEMIP